LLPADAPVSVTLHMEIIFVFASKWSLFTNSCTLCIVARCRDA